MVIGVGEQRTELGYKGPKKMVRGGTLPQQGKAEVRRCGLPSRVTFQAISLIRICIRKEQGKGKLGNI